MAHAHALHVRAPNLERGFAAHSADCISPPSATFPQRPTGLLPATNPGDATELIAPKLWQKEGRWSFSQ
jgi:hypothetical protein